MRASSHMRSPAPVLANGKDRAEVVRSGFTSIISNAENENDFAAVYLARRFGLSPCMARTVAALVSLGRAFQ